MAKVLIVDDEQSIHSSIERLFRKDDISFFSAFDGDEALEVLQKETFDILLADLKMPKMNGIQLLERIKDRYPNLIRLILTGYGTTDDVVRAMKLGADDFLEKPLIAETFYRKLMQNLKTLEYNEGDTVLGDNAEAMFSFSPLQGKSKSILELKRMILRIAPININVLIQGETGTGKELVAKAVHHQSLRNRDAFIPVNCSSLNESLFESELFGHEKGAFTGAHTANPGIIRSAHGGTLFLDEIGELSRHLQVKLLRVIQTRIVRPVGGTRSYPVDVRIITATNQDLEQEVAKNNFRKDLFFRLNVVTLDIPPLRERESDIPLLVRYFIEHNTVRSSPVRCITDEAMAVLERYSWPGNVRELENVVIRAVALCNNENIGISDLPQNVINENDTNGTLKELESVRDLEIKAVKNALAKYGGDKKAASEALGMGIATLYRKIKRYQIY